MKRIILILSLASLYTLAQGQQKYTQAELNEIQRKIETYTVVDLNYDLRKLPKHEMAALPFLLTAAEIADSIFWQQSFGSKNFLLNSVENDTLKNFIEINYGPWERLNNNKPFVKGYGEKPKGVNFYPKNITKSEFDQLDDSSKINPYTVLKRNSGGKLYTRPYSEEYMMYNQGIQSNLQEAASMVGPVDTSFAIYMWERGNALVTNDYRLSDIKWLNSNNNILDIIVGPVESYEDQFKGIKTAYEAYIVAKDVEWSRKLQKYVALLPKLQSGLPIAKEYKTALPGLKSQIGAYDVLFYSGDCNSGSKTIAVNLPNDEGVQSEYGTRRLQFKNVMRAKFDSILVPISNVLIDSSQRKYINFNSFFANTMFHEVAHGLGIKNTIKGNLPVSQALEEHYSSMEEGKADVLGLYMITELLKSGDLKEGALEEYYTTFIASIFRSVRFGASSAHGKANMVRFNYFIEQGALSKNDNGTYIIDFDKMKKAVYQLSNIILVIQGDGDKQGAKKLLDEKGVVSAELKQDLERLKEFKIPVDIVFNQGLDQLKNYTNSLPREK